MKIKKKEMRRIATYCMIPTALCSIAFLPYTAMARKVIPVFIAAGQSNTDGRVLNAVLPDYIKQNKYHHTYWCYNNGVYSSQGKFSLFWPRIYNEKNPDKWAYDAVTYYYLDQSMGTDYYVIKESKGGTSINPDCNSTDDMHWSASSAYLSQTAAADKGGKSMLKALCDNIDLCIEKGFSTPKDAKENYAATSAKKENFEIKALLWHQGESDHHCEASYYENLKAMIAYIRRHLVAKTGNKKYARLPIIIGGISHKSQDYSPQVESAQRRLAQEDKNIHLVEVPDASLQDDHLHFDAQGAEMLGKKMYAKLVELKLAGKKARVIQ